MADPDDKQLGIRIHQPFHQVVHCHVAGGRGKHLHPKTTTMKMDFSWTQGSLAELAMSSGNRMRFGPCATQPFKRRIGLPKISQKNPDRN